MKHVFTPENVCSTKISFDLDGDVVSHIRFTSGCNGNLQAVARLLDGVTVDFLEQKCAGIRCGRNHTSCADQLARAVAFAAGK